MFGYFYAQNIAVFSICIFFSATVPLVPVATAVFCLLRHWVDCLNLLNVHRKEIDSQGVLIDDATNTTLIIIVAYQICMMAFFSFKGLHDEAAVVTVIFLASIFLIVLTSSPISVSNKYETANDELDQIYNGDEQKLSTIVNNWRAEFDHPCVVSKSRRKTAFTMNDVFKDVDDWTRFENDSRI